MSLFSTLLSLYRAYFPSIFNKCTLFLTFPCLVQFFGTATAWKEAPRVPLSGNVISHNVWWLLKRGGGCQGACVEFLRSLRRGGGAPWVAQAGVQGGESDSGGSGTTSGSSSALREKEDTYHTQGLRKSQPQARKGRSRISWHQGLSPKEHIPHGQ